MMPIFSVKYLVSLGLIPESATELLKYIREFNPLLFDFVLKRALRSNGKALPTRVFETREFFMRSSRHVGQ
jgi:mannonate dehydratase